jgi:hypothetical protein
VQMVDDQDTKHIRHTTRRQGRLCVLMTVLNDRLLGTVDQHSKQARLLVRDYMMCVILLVVEEG